MIKSYHKIHSQVEPASPIKKIDFLYKECLKERASLPEDIDRNIEMIKKKMIPLSKESVICHNDLFFQNILLSDDNRLWLIDWKYSDWGDLHFDLAGLCVEHRLNREERELLSSLYFGNSRVDFEKLEFMYMLYSLKTALWGFLQKAKNPNMQFDILKIANMHYINFLEMTKKNF